MYQACRLRLDVEIVESLDSRLCSNASVVLEEDELLELEPRFSLAWARTLAPLESGEIDAKTERALPASEL